MLTALEKINIGSAMTIEVEIEVRQRRISKLLDPIIARAIEENDEAALTDLVMNRLTRHGPHWQRCNEALRRLTD